MWICRFGISNLNIAKKVKDTNGILNKLLNLGEKKKTKSASPISQSVELIQRIVLASDKMFSNLGSLQLDNICIFGMI